MTNCVNLQASTIEANKRFFESADQVPKQAYTMGIGTIMRAKSVLLIVSGADKAETEAAESRIRQARQTAYNFFDDLNLEIADTWTRYMAAIEQRKYYQEAVVYNTQTRDAYLAQFNLGQRSLLDVLDAESELFNSATQEATARGNEIVGAYRLYALAGQFLPVLNIDDKSLYVSQRESEPSK